MAGGTCMAGGGWQGACMVGEHAWQGGMCGRGHAWVGVCMCGRGCAWQEGVHGREGTAAGGTHPTGMHSCLE